jgi:hypothetical protein
MNIVFLFVGISVIGVIGVLAFYTGSLLFKLRSQQQLREQKTKKRKDF